MNLSALQPSSAARTRRGVQAFTMIEIALALGVIGIALVAIIGILPQAVDVQKNNRRDTIVNQDASYYIDALRGGEQHLDDLTNYVMNITNHWVHFKVDGTNILESGDDSYSATNPAVVTIPTNVFKITNPALPAFTDFRLTNGQRILGVMSTPQYFTLPDGTYVSNNVVVYARSMSGTASEKSPQTNSLVRDLGFSYRFAVQIVPRASGATNWNNGSFDAQFDRDLGTNAAGKYEKELRKNLHTNLCDVRLYFRWPFQPNGDVGTGQKKFRVEVGGSIVHTNEAATGVRLFYFRPQLHVTLPAS